MGASQHEAQLLPHAPRHFAHPHADIAGEALCQIGPLPQHVPPADHAEDSQRLAAVHPRGEPEVSGKVPDIRLDPAAIAPAVQAEDARPTGGGAKES